MKGFDCASTVTKGVAEAFAKEKYGFVCRYIVPTGWKRIQKEEVAIINKAGLQVVSVFQIKGDKASMTAEQGKKDGISALAVAKSLGQPVGTAIYFAVDHEAPASEMNAIEAYIRAAGKEITGYNSGIYGSFDVIEAMASRKACKHFWQTRAWSKGKISKFANIHQYDCGSEGQGLMKNGLNVDLNDSFGNEGGWTTMAEKPPVVVQPQLPPLGKADADKLIALLSEAYKLGVTKLPTASGEVISVDQAEIHRLANVIRVLSGQKI